MTLSTMQNFGLARPAPVKAKPKPALKKPQRPAAPAMPAGMAVQSTAPAPPPPPADTRKYGGEFYPVVKTGKE
jgi:hypothetical protein